MSFSKRGASFANTSFSDAASKTTSSFAAAADGPPAETTTMDSAAPRKSRRGSPIERRILFGIECGEHNMRGMAGGKWAENLRETDELFRTTVENLPINLVLYDREYRILYMNPALAAIAAAICKRPPEELVGLRGAELWPPPIWEPLHEHTERAVATRERQTYELATNLPGRGHTVREWTVVPLVDAAGEVDRILAMSVDVTAQRRLVQELRDADQRKSEFIAVLSHELRNPLAAIRLSLHVIDNLDARSDEAIAARRIIDRQVGQLVHLVDDLLDVSRITQNKIQLQRHRLDINDVVRATIDDNRAHLEQGGVRIEAGLARTPIYVNADGVRIAQVLTNLLANAVNFTPRGGKATVTVSSSEIDGAAVLSRDRHRQRDRSGAVAPAVRALHAGGSAGRALGRRPGPGPGAGQGAGGAARWQRERDAARGATWGRSSSCASRSMARPWSARAPRRSSIRRSGVAGCW